MIVPDINLLLYAVHSDSPQHPIANRWFERVLGGDEPVGFAWTVVMGFLRITTNPRAYASPMRPDVALALVDEWRARRVVSMIDPGVDHWRILGDLLRQSGTAANLTPDAHLAALCIERGATLYSADAGFGRFQSLQWVNPLRG